jgi:dUTP pyrophosphatase
MRIRIKKVRDDIPTPGYAYTSDAGYDLIAGEDVIIRPGETVKIPTGLAFEIQEGYEMQVRPRSGVTSKTPLRVALGTIDASYRGEVSVICENTSTDNWSNMARLIDNSYAHETIEKYRPGTYLIRKGSRIAQGVIAPIVRATFEVVDELGETGRGTGGFGSSGVKS